MSLERCKSWNPKNEVWKSAQILPEKWRTGPRAVPPPRAAEPEAGAGPAGAAGAAAAARDVALRADQEEQVRVRVVGPEDDVAAVAAVA